MKRKQITQIKKVKPWKEIFLCGLLMLASMLTACGNQTSENAAQNEEQSQTADVSQSEEQIQNTETTQNDEQSQGTEASPSEEQSQDTEEIQPGSKILVAYFTRLPNTVSGDDLDAVVQGGGPYGEIGSDFEHADLDAIASASITITEEGVKGNVQTIAEWIAEYTNGDLFSIETTEKYPLDYDTLIEIGGQEQRDAYRPELSTELANLEDYSIIYLGYPNWYYDMPMALYTFLDSYNLEGKIIVPFATSAGSGFSNTISSIAEMEPDAEVIETGLSIRMGDVGNSEDAVKQWIDSLNLEP